MREVISTGCKELDELLGGGFYKGVLTGIFAEPKVGKSWLSFQVACKLASEGGTSLIVDTEQFFTPQTVRVLFKYFQKRFDLGDLDLKKIKILQKVGVQQVYPLFGYSVYGSFEGSSKFKVIVSGNYDFNIKKRRGEEPIAVHKIPIKNMLDGVELLIIDTFTTPIKSFVPSGMENLSARSSLETPILSTINQLAAEFQLAALVTHHSSTNPTLGAKAGKPWGGAFIVTQHKYIIQMLEALKADREKLIKKYGITPDEAQRARRIILWRHAFKDSLTDNEIIVALHKDWGFDSVERWRMKGVNP